jgi:diacylglycerol kinase (ATP)
MNPYLKKRAASFGYAFKGIMILVSTQPHIIIHIIVAVIVIIAGFLCGLSKTEWLFIILAIALVFVAEAINTAIEFTIDLLSPEHHPIAGKAKDVAAAAVLIAAFFAVIIGLVVFLPKLF